MTLFTVLKAVSTMSRAASCALLGLCLLAGLTSRAHAASAASYVVTRTADDTLPGSLRAAITAASATGGTITFAIPNTDPGYSSAANTDTITLSLGPLIVPASLSIAGPTAPAATATIVGVGAYPNQSNVFSVTGGTVAISNLTIKSGISYQGVGGGDILNAATLTLTNCAVIGGSAFQNAQVTVTQGGDILNTGTLTMSGCTVSGGTAFGGNGGGISNSGSGAGLTLTNCTISGNMGQFGGGLANSGTLTASGCLFSGNQVNSNGGGGGGLYNTGMVTLNTCTFSGNGAGTTYAAGGGGVYNNGPGAGLTLNNCVLNNNSTISVGGGINSTGTLTLSACTISSNSAGRGYNNYGTAGGVYTGGTAQITNCLFVGNSSPIVGGMFNSGTLSLINSTFASNSAYTALVGISGTPAAGLYSGPATLVNDIFYFDTYTNSNGVTSPNEIAASATAAPTVTFSDVQGGYAGTGDISADPQFVRNPSLNVSPADPGDEHLKLTSPAVHTGANGPGVPLTDIEGTARPTPPATPSMGAYEVPGSASGFSAQGGFLVTGTQNVSTGAQVVAKFLPGTTPAASFTASVNLGDGAVVIGNIVPDPNTAGVLDVTVSHTYTAYGAFPVAVTISGPNNAPTATVTSTANIQPAQIAANVTSQVSVTGGGFIFNRATRRFVQTVTIKNNGTVALTGPFSLALDNLTTGATLFGATGTTQYAPGPAGSPYQNAPASTLAPGATTTVVLQLTYTGSSLLNYTPRVLAGPGAR